MKAKMIALAMMIVGLVTGGCISPYYISRADLREMNGDNVHPVIITNNTPYYVTADPVYAAEGCYNTVRTVGPYKVWVFETDKPSIVLTASVPSVWYGGCVRVMVTNSFGRCDLKIRGRKTIVLTTNDFPAYTMVSSPTLRTTSSSSSRY